MPRRRLARGGRLDSSPCDSSCASGSAGPRISPKAGPRLVTSLQRAGAVPPIALRWWEGMFYCEFRESHNGSELRIVREGHVVWEQGAVSATEAFRRAAEVVALLTEQRLNKG